jgi:hypothetical protein
MRDDRLRAASAGRGERSANSCRRRSFAEALANGEVTPIAVIPEIERNSDAFASGARRNDIGEQMRNIARRMTPDEIATASRFYADRP